MDAQLAEDLTLKIHHEEEVVGEVVHQSLSRWREHELWPVAMITGSCHSKPNFCLLSGPDAKIDDLVELLAVATCLSLLGRSKRVHSVLRMQMQQTTRIQREQNKFR